MSPHYYTVEIRYVGRAPETRRIDAARTVIGRDGGDIVLHDGQASAAHAEIEFQNGQVVVRDLGSTNGTWFGGRQLPQFALSPGQVFRCGHTDLRLLEIVGGQPLVAGRTIVADAGPPVPGPRAPHSPMSYAPSTPAGAQAGPAPSPPVAHPASSSKPSPAAIIGAIVGGVVLLGAAGTGAWLVLRDDKPVANANADANPDADPDAELEPTPTPAEADGGDTGGAAPESLGPDDPDLGKLYRAVGAATVVVRVPGSVGSGAIIDPRGVILTNHHVIDGGEREGLSVKAKVVLGDYSEELHTFEPRHEQLDAWVIKVDKDHDLALIELVDPPAGLAHVALAKQNPYPGQRVAAIGHAGVGMLWAIKGGEISAAGSLAGHLDLLLDAHEGDRDGLEREKKRFEKMGRVIQSTAKILPGDSGGPLVNLERELVGVNAFGRIDRATNQWLSFHIHRAEVENFTADIPTRPLAMIPDPWDHAGPWSRVEDANLDGRADVLLIDGTGGGGGDGLGTSGVLLDLDGDSFAAGSGAAAAPEQVNADIATFVEDRRLDAEFIRLREPGGAHHYWYDRDGDGSFDLYFVDPLGLGEPPKAWTLDRHGGAEKIEGLELGNGLRPELFTDAKLAAAFRDLGAVVFPGSIEAQAGGRVSLPVPSHNLDGAVEFADGDGDGLHDTLVETAAFDQRTFLDLDQNSIARTSNAAALEVLLEVATVDAELALIQQGTNAWVWYDTDDDGRLDLVLHGYDLALGIAHEAFRVTSPGADPIPAPDQVGRRLLRPALLTNASVRERLAHHPLAQWSAGPGDDGLASFPDLRRTPAASIQIDGALARVVELGHDLLLLDLDGDSADPNPQVVAERVRGGSYDAEFALLRQAGSAWAFYDRDGDGRFDRVLISLGGEGSATTQAYEIAPTAATLTPNLAGTALLDPAQFASASLRASFEAQIPSLE